MEEQNTPAAAPDPNAAPAPAEQTSNEYPVQVEVAYPASQSRLLAFFSLPFFLARLLLLVPSFVVLYFLQLAAFVGAWINLWAILFTGHGSPGLQHYVTGTLRWSTRLSAYMYGLTDKYPPFRLGP